jgi:hypothetical protein
MKHFSMANADQRRTLRICDVPGEVPIGEALRKADRIAFGHLDVAPSIRPASLAWEFITGASTSEH